MMSLSSPCFAFHNDVKIDFVSDKVVNEFLDHGSFALMSIEFAET